MNPTFERYFESFRSMSADEVWERYEYLYGLWESCYLDDAEIEQSVWNELHSIEMFLGIDDDPDLEDFHNVVDTAGYDDWEDEAAWHDTCDQDEEPDSPDDIARAEMDWWEFCQLNDIPFC